MRLNLGCGRNQRKGWVNVDQAPECKPDQVVDLEEFPWPWDSDSIEEIEMRHVLEHLGATTDIYLGLISEMWRVCKPGARITIVVPHPRHDSFLNDPTHVRPVTAPGLELFSQELNREWARTGKSNTPLGLYLDIDFKVENISFNPDEPWRGRYQRGEIDFAGLNEAMRMYNNVVSEVTITLHAVKPAGAAVDNPDSRR